MRKRKRQGKFTRYNTLGSDTNISCSSAFGSIEMNRRSMKFKIAGRKSFMVDWRPWEIKFCFFCEYYGRR